MSSKNKINKTKQTLINQNLAQTKFGMYANCFTGNPVKNQFSQTFNIGEVNNICEVEVVNIHAVDAIEQYCLRNLKPQLKDGWINPVTMCVVGDDFIGSNYPQSESIRDDTFNIRTNFNTITRHQNLFPLKETTCVYNRFITVIREMNLTPITDLNNLYRFGLITVAPLNKPTLLDENRMCSTDYLKMLQTVETIFQTAIAGNHNVLILTPFGNTVDDVPQEDIVMLYNQCIFKYGHRFKKIIIAVPVWYGTYLFDLFNNEIVKPQEFEEIEEPDPKIKQKIKTKNSKNKKSTNKQKVN
jgi:hypothetical protein